MICYSASWSMANTGWIMKLKENNKISHINLPIELWRNMVQDVIIHKCASSYFFHLLFSYEVKWIVTTLGKGNTGYSIWAKSLKAVFCDIWTQPKQTSPAQNCSGKRLVGWKRGLSLHSQKFPSPIPDETEIAHHILENHSAWKTAWAEASNWHFLSQVPSSAPAHPAHI